MVGEIQGTWVKRRSYYMFLVFYSPDTELGTLPVATYASFLTF